MHLYNCKVRLGGSLYNEVPKPEITAAEITVLRVIHGDDSVVDIEPAGENKKLSSLKVRSELALQYGKALRGIEGVGSLNGVFGVAGELPPSLPGFEPAKKAAPAAKGKTATTVELPADAVLAENVEPPADDAEFA